MEEHGEYMYDCIYYELIDTGVSKQEIDFGWIRIAMPLILIISKQWDRNKV